MTTAAEDVIRENSSGPLMSLLTRSTFMFSSVPSSLSSSTTYKPCLDGITGSDLARVAIVVDLPPANVLRHVNLLVIPPKEECLVSAHLVHNIEGREIAGEFRHCDIEVDADVLVSVLLDDVVGPCYTGQRI